MHNNFYFLRQVTQKLESQLKNSVVSECFSQSKDELIVRFEMGSRSFFIRGSLLPEISCLSFADNFQRARKNSIDLFPQVIGRQVLGMRQFKNERSFSIRLSDHLDILFKMHGNRTNVILFFNGKVIDVFRKKLTADLSIELDSLDREIDWSAENFERHADNPKTLYFTFGKVVWKYLEDHGFASQDTAEKWHAIQSVRRQLENPSYYIVTLDAKPTLSLLKVGNIRKAEEDPIEAANEFFYVFTHEYAFTKQKSNLLTLLNARLSAGENYCKKNVQKLEEVLKDNQYRIWADLIMANMHAIEPGAEVAVLENFYEDQRPIKIKLKKDLTPQKNAELFYRKAKNQHLEIDRLQRSVREKQDALALIRKEIAEVESAVDLKSLKSLQQRLKPEATQDESSPLPYHEFYMRDFRIWVGKNAQANDTLTLKYSHKEDLWLHAKDVSGSHVLIKHQSGKNFPRDVIAYAASLAAFNSRRRNETLCPVIVTPKKFVRKRKGDPPGAVVVEREEVIMVEPLKGR